MPLEDEIEKYIKALDKFIGGTKIFFKRDVLTFKVKGKFVSFTRTNESDFEYILTLPLKLKNFNEKLPEDDRLVIGFNYLPPAQVVELLDDEHCNAGEILIEERREALDIHCESYGYVTGFLRFYGKNF